MDKLEYIPGDLVHVPKFSNSIYKVISCGTYPYEVRDINDNDAITEESSIVPIPITPEILEKNGWKKSKINDCAYFYYKDGVFLTYTSKDGKFWFDDFDYSSSICVELPYVHSLQHFLFGLGLNSGMEV